jgi:solute carrier family 25 (mitochondrial phosphate transporter), member 23/24/25/41
MTKYPQQLLTSLQSHLSDTLSDTQKNLLCGGLAGCVGKTFIAPLNRITILLQVSDHSATTRISTIQTAIGIWKEEGVKAFWKGNLTSIIHRFPYSAINFSAYEILRDSLCGKGN